MLKETALTWINKAIHQALSSDESIQTLLKPLNTQVIAIHITGLDKTVFCLFKTNTVEICDQYEGTVNASLSGGPFSLLAMLLNNALDVTGVRIQGEIATAQHAKHFAEKLDIDWETLLANKIGDMPAYHLHKLGRHFKTYFGKQYRQFQENLGDYLKDEKQVLVSPEQVEILYQGIDECRFDVDRLSARLQHLKNENSV